MTISVDTYELVEARAIRWLADSMEFFDPQRYHPDHPRLRDHSRRAVTELAALITLRLRIDERPLTTEYLAMVDHLAAVTQRASFLGLVARRRWSLWVCGMPHVALRLAGREDPGQRWLLQQAASAGTPLTWEREAWRHLAHAHFLRLAEIDHSLPTLTQAFPMTLLYGLPNVAMTTEPDAYAISHTVWYITDFGLSRPPWPEGFAVGDAREIIVALLRRFRLEEQSDLVAELAACAVALGDAMSPEVGAAWQYLCRQQRTDGSLPSPPHLLPGRTWDDYYGDCYGRWRTAYHTTIVSVMAGLMARRATIDPGYPVSVPSTQRELRLRQGVVAALTRGGDWLFEQAAAGLVRRCAILALGGGCLGFWALDDGDRLERATLLLGRRLKRCGDDLGWKRLGRLAASTLLVLLKKRGVYCPSLEDFVSGMSEFPGTDTSGCCIPGIERQLVQACGAYRLGEAALSVQALVEVGRGGARLTRDGIEMLLAQQRIDGSFGHLVADGDGPETTHLRLVWTAQIIGTLSVSLLAGAPNESL